MITTHSLSEEAFTALACGGGDGPVVRQLHDAQLSKHLMLLRVLAEVAEGAELSSPASAAFHAGYQLLARAQSADPGAVATVLGLPHIGSWEHDCLACLDGVAAPPNLGYLAAVAAATAVKVGIPFALDAPVQDGRLALPGLGCLLVGDQGEWVRLSSDGERLRAGREVDVACERLVPDDGSGDFVPHWRGTPLVRAACDGRTWEVLLETGDRCLDRYMLPMLTVMTAAEAGNWRRRIQSAWELLVRHHEWAAGPVAEGVSVIVPLVPRSDLDSATSPAAFGAVATSLPPSAVSMAEILIHELQHIKLCGLMDMLPLTEPGDRRGYAPWREDPRPMGGILQGLYAFAGIVRYWDVQRHLEPGPDRVLRGNVLYERWRSALEPVAETLLSAGVLTPDGVRFVTALKERGRDADAAPVPAEAVEIAAEVALDNWLTWQLRHTVVDVAEVAGLAAAYRDGESFDGQILPVTWIEDDIRKVDSVPRSRLIHMRYQNPLRFRALAAADMAELDVADVLLIGEDADAAVEAYRVSLTAAPDPAAWIGLALAIRRLPAASSRPVFASHLPLLFEMHACLADQGIYADPLDLAAWFE
ncbi:MAG TPA: HEXXH motif domain-containing protein [Trebonia sp.]